MTNSAQTLSNEGMYENSNAILNKLHRKFISFESAKLHNFNQQKIGKKLIFSENQLNKLKVKNEIVQNSKELKKKYKSNQKQIIELARCLRIAKIDKIACKKALSKLISEGNREALVELALIEFTNGNKKGAVNLLERASNYPKTSRASNLNLARIYAQENNLTKIENHLKKLNNDLDPEALIISSLVAYQTKNYPKALSYSQLFIKSHGISQEIMTILANSALHIYKSFPSKPNRRLLEQISKQFTKISNFNNKSFNHAVSSIMLELNKLDLAQKYASKSKNETLIEDIELKMLKNQLISNQITDWASILSKYSQKHSPKAIIEIKISSLIELKELNEAQRLLKELDNGRLNYYQILIHHLNHNYDQRNNLISKTSKPVKMWQILAQLSYKDKFFNEAAACYENALKLEPNNLILSNNYINCAIMNSNSDLNQLLIDANLNYKNFPQPETLNTLVEVLKKSDQDHAIIKLLESQKSLSLKHELLLTKIYQNHAPKKAVALIVKVLSTKGELIDEIEKVELKEWLAVCKINH
jgi:tetratricopeptide (TPR) repeat protein